MATDALFNFYEILVENIFGSVGLAILAIGIVILLILIICRASSILMVYWISIYFMVMVSFYVGTFALVISSIGAIVYIVWAFQRAGSNE